MVKAKTRERKQRGAASPKKRGAKRAEAEGGGQEQRAQGEATERNTRGIGQKEVEQRALQEVKKMRRFEPERQQSNAARMVSVEA